MPRRPLFHIVMYEPEIPNNTGNIGRTCIATGCDLHLIKPLGFDTSEKALRRAGLDYWPRLQVREHDNWAQYVQAMGVTSDMSIAGDSPADEARSPDSGSGAARADRSDTAISSAGSRADDGPRADGCASPRAGALGAETAPPHRARRPLVYFTSGKFGTPIWDVDFSPGDHIVFGPETRGLPDDMLDANPQRVITLPMLEGERGLNVATAVCTVIYEGLRQCVARGDVRVTDGRLVLQE